MAVWGAFPYSIIDMRVKILGSAAGGGFPQWNCSCVNCSRLRDRKLKGVGRTQAQLAWTSQPGEWALLNASPDLRFQIEATPELWPREGTRHSPICDVIVPSAEIDQALGLLLLREFHSFRIHTTSSIRRILTEDNSIFGVLARFTGQAGWNNIALDHSFFACGARLEVLPLPASFPGFVSPSRSAELSAKEAVIGLLISPEAGGKTLAFLPGVASVPDALLERLQTSDVVLFDGTFWNDQEPAHIPGLNRTARQMGHLPVTGSGGSLERLAALERTRKIYIHVNHTNPILDEESLEHRMVRDAGWEVAWDGMEITL